MAKDNFKRLVKQYGLLSDPLVRARQRICELLERDVEKAKKRYEIFLKKKER